MATLFATTLLVNSTKKPPAKRQRADLLTNKEVGATEMATIRGLKVEVAKDSYTGLWFIRYVSGGKWAGPYKTKKEAKAKLDQDKD